MSFLMGVSLLGVVTAVACAVPGVFVVLRRDAMMVDAISHAALPGIAIGYILTQDLSSPWLVIGAAIAGLVVVMAAEWLSHTGLLTGDAPIGLMFPALFSIGVLLITDHASNVHLDEHTVLVGDLNLAAFKQFSLFGVTLGPQHLFVMLGVLLMNVIFIAVTFPRLTLTTLDPAFARTLGMSPLRLQMVFMLMVSLTGTASFYASGAVLVIAQMIIPPAAALLLSRTVTDMLWLSAGIAAMGALGGFWAAYVIDLPTSAAMAVFLGLILVVAVVISRVRRWMNQRGARHAEALEEAAAAS